MEIRDINHIEQAAGKSRPELLRFGLALLFVIGIMFYTWASGGGNIMLIVAGMIGGYMALNIGANDVANNVGPAVGSRALSLGGALVIAAIFEAAGALIAGGDVVSTIRGGIIAPSAVANSDIFVWLMLAALLAGAIWLNIATASGAPVSTTHSIVGGVLGAGIAAGGWGVANWGTMGSIAASWIISPLMGGLVAAGFLYFIKHRILYRQDVMAAARRVVPLLVAGMAWAFTTYLMLKGVRAVLKVGFVESALAGGVVALLTYVVVRPRVGQGPLGGGHHPVLRRHRHPGPRRREAEGAPRVEGRRPREGHPVLRAVKPRPGPPRVHRHDRLHVGRKLVGPEDDAVLQPSVVVEARVGGVDPHRRQQGRAGLVYEGHRTTHLGLRGLRARMAPHGLRDGLREGHPWRRSALRRRGSAHGGIGPGGRGPQTQRERERSPTAASSGVTHGPAPRARLRRRRAARCAAQSGRARCTARARGRA